MSPRWGNQRGLWGSHILHKYRPAGETKEVFGVHTFYIDVAPLGKPKRSLGCTRFVAKIRCG